MSELRPHRLIERALKKSQLPSFEQLAPEWQDFALRLSQSYVEMEQSQQRLNHAIELSSAEMRTLYTQLEAENEILETKVHLRTAELQKAMEDATESSAAKSRFLANMSHEIRTPMNGILTAADLMLREAQDPSQLDLTQVIHRSATSLLRILNDILDLSKIQGQSVRIESIPFDPQILLEDVRRLFEPMAIEKDLLLQLQIEGKWPPCIQGDPYRIRQTLVNLVGNALKFTKTGEINIRAHCQHRSQSYEITIDVIDTGIGIPEHMLENIFEAFAQGDDSTTRQFGGTGLGLSITKSLCELMGLNLSVASEMGKGSKFTLEGTFLGAEFGPEVVEEEPQWTGSRCVLLVDDNTINLKMSKKVLERLGLQVETAEDGLQAIQSALDGTFDIILMDIHMPNMGGLEATHVLREKHGYTAPIIALTANILAEDHIHYVSNGMNDCLTKPFTHHNLVKLLNLYL